MVLWWKMRHYLYQRHSRMKRNLQEFRYWRRTGVTKIWPIKTRNGNCGRSYLNKNIWNLLSIFRVRWRFVFVGNWPRLKVSRPIRVSFGLNLAQDWRHLKKYKQSSAIWQTKASVRRKKWTFFFSSVRYCLLIWHRIPHWEEIKRIIKYFTRGDISLRHFAFYSYWRNCHSRVPVT